MMLPNGGTGTLDGTWIGYRTGEVMPNGNTCNLTCVDSTPGVYGPNWCTTAPLGPATQNPCVETIGCPGESLCWWSCTDMSVAGTGQQGQDWWIANETPLFGGSVNPAWIAGQPTWGGLEDKGWGINVSLLGTDSAVLSTALNSSIGTVVTPATLCLSAETSATLDYPYATLQSCNDVCFPSLDPWWCDQSGGGCVQDPLGTFGWATSVPAGPYATNNDAYTACTATCNSVTSYTCSNVGCVQDPTGQFPDIESCTAVCQSYSCTTQGCLGPFAGTGATGTYVEWSSCTGTCYHYECVTDVTAAAVLPNIYQTGPSSTNGCIQTSGYTSEPNHYTTLSACTGSCIAWQCCEPLGITDDSVMYVYYDITSMNTAQVQNAIQGIIDWTEQHTEFTGHVYHLLWWTERWLTYPSFAYDKKIYRFEDVSPSSYPGYSNTNANFGAAGYGSLTNRLLGNW